MGKFFRKGFHIELDDPLQYPSAKVICDTILEKEKDSELIFTEKPVSFRQGNVLYEVDVTMGRGGYVLHCKEIKE